MTIDELIDEPNPLTIEQHGLLRDGGFPEAELEGKTQAYFSKNKKHANYKSHKQPALALQLEYLKHRGIDLRDRALTYGNCRKAIRKLAQMDASDEKYLRYIAAYEQDNAGRKNRGKGKSSEFVPVCVPKSVPNETYQTLDDVPVDDVQRLVNTYVEAYTRYNGTEPTEDLTAVSTLIRNHIYKHAPNVDVLAKAIVYYVGFYDSEQFGKSLAWLFDGKKSWLLDKCVQQSAGVDLNVLQAAKDHNMTVKQVQSAIRRGDIAVERMDLRDLEEALVRFDDLMGFLREDHTEEELTPFKQRLDITRALMTPYPDVSYLKNAIAVIIDTFNLNVDEDGEILA